ncbi:MAG: hypothetical protein A2W93_00300 [Bacteroidetes bacterium GWF2_43_63]|nr:MAG: hypothetical protein A2W94_13220 [Bacteroidetes bacterium GWE2_42_42]OFY53846.1 MAG: hypothetical protein A2W93_00300 [Bacteroidetes bacterium GWF2_43_63]HBG69804.1 hypothetical protein [Bacteroidales bacterium]HCB60998.1 hypothetical protein [Bacteroidales bacterium]HCY24554.1 hypothetical protein [Bacteroidales bacterium]
MCRISAKIFLVFLSVFIFLTSCSENIENRNAIAKSAVKTEKQSYVQPKILYKGLEKIWNTDILLIKLLRDRKVRNTIVGQWKCIDMDERGGVHELSIVLAEQIKNSILHINYHEYYFENDCVFENPIIYKHFTSYFIDTSDYYSFFLRSAMFYQPTDNIKKMENLFFQTDDKRFTNCYKCCISCGGFFKVADTLLYENGGYVFSFVKNND